MYIEMLSYNLTETEMADLKNLSFFIKIIHLQNS